VKVKSLMGVKVIAHKTVMRVMTVMKIMMMIMTMNIRRQAAATLMEILLRASKHDSHMRYFLSVTRIVQNSNNNFFRYLDNFICNVVRHCYNFRCFLLYHSMHYSVNREHFAGFYQSRIPSTVYEAPCDG
jgi:hypothetical protein